MTVRFTWGKLLFSIASDVFAIDIKVIITRLSTLTVIILNMTLTRVVFNNRISLLMPFGALIILDIT